MSFSTDRDLLALEPLLFSEIVFAGQKIMEVSDGLVSGASLGSATADFATAQIEGGDVVLIAGVPCEVIARIDANTLTVSKLRSELSDAAVPPGNGSSLTVIHYTFGPQRQVTHDELLRLLGIDADGHSALTEDAIVSLSVMRELETLGTLMRLYEAAVSMADESEVNDARQVKAKGYQQRYREACRAARVHLDLDGDGVADCVRQPGVIELIRQ